MLLPIEVQGYIRHVLHLIGVVLVAKAGIDQTMMDLYVGAGVNLISLLWFLYTEYKRVQANKPAEDPVAAVEPDVPAGNIEQEG